MSTIYVNFILNFYYSLIFTLVTNWHFSKVNTFNTLLLKSSLKTLYNINCLIYSFWWNIRTQQKVIFIPFQTEDWFKNSLQSTLGAYKFHLYVIYVTNSKKFSNLPSHENEWYQPLPISLKIHAMYKSKPSHDLMIEADLIFEKI